MINWQISKFNFDRNLANSSVQNKNHNNSNSSSGGGGLAYSSNEYGKELEAFDDDGDNNNNINNKLNAPHAKFGLEKQSSMSGGTSSGQNTLPYTNRRILFEL